MQRIITVTELQHRLAKTKTLLLLDVRREVDLMDDPVRIPGAERRDPAHLATWAATLPGDVEIVVYCVRGRSVSNGVVDHLQRLGIAARLLEGGIDAWKQAGGPVEVYTK